eukprot:TRINITY_DN824_c0_g2_i1.p1 TRINITY_DN824_c0_g2~~TRINITY_DN824_c0_g2_i1.p1  ORF type:complete len:112 (+),score=29.25 TRINITY_DN824_c0_g2_i1:141-476(+)
MDLENTLEKTKEKIRKLDTDIIEMESTLPGEKYPINKQKKKIEKIKKKIDSVVAKEENITTITEREKTNINDQIKKIFLIKENLTLIQKQFNKEDQCLVEYCMNHNVFDNK